MELLNQVGYPLSIASPVEILTFEKPFHSYLITTFSLPLSYLTVNGEIHCT